ncbi:MAG: Wzz/FepE/Etk N-terminal domain-containing protein, partial [Acidobacteriota bacterium]|nr:Wzz/FepE/Etk N-terminal domain-containing protein [Acidobacteriota bacterium]
MHTSHSVGTPPFDEPRLIDYLSVLSRRRRLILGGTLAVVLLGLAAIMLLPRVYQSTATIMVVAAKLDGQGTPMEAQLGTYRAILDSEGIAAQVLAEAGLDKPPHNLQVTDV